MRIEEIPKLTTESVTSKDLIELRRGAPSYLTSVVGPLHDEGVFTDIQGVSDIPQGHIVPLSDGVHSACYWINEVDRATVLKLRFTGVDAEAEWLNAYHIVGVNVPRVLSSGVVPPAPETSRPIKYIALEGISNNHGERSKSGRNFDNNPNLIKGLSREMGRELAKIHSAKTGKAFGKYTDAGEPINPKNTWIEYLEDYLGTDHLDELGIPEEDRLKLISVLRTVTFPIKGEGVYVHGDFGLHNILVSSDDPLEPCIVIMDPNPTVGDPYFDLANQANIREIREATVSHISKIDPLPWMAGDTTDYDVFIQAYREVTGNEIDEKRLAANQLVKLIQLIEERRGRDPEVMSETEKNDNIRDTNIRIQLAKGKVDFLIGK